MPLESHLFRLVAFFERDSNGTLIPIPWKPLEKRVLLRRSSACRSLEYLHLSRCCYIVAQGSFTFNAAQESMMAPVTWCSLHAHRGISGPEPFWPTFKFVIEDVSTNPRPKALTSKFKDTFSPAGVKLGWFLDPKNEMAYAFRRGRDNKSPTFVDSHGWPWRPTQISAIYVADWRSHLSSMFFIFLLLCSNRLYSSSRHWAGNLLPEGFPHNYEFIKPLNDMRVESPNIEQCRHISRNRVVDGSGVGTSSFRLLYYFAET